MLLTAIICVSWSNLKDNKRWKIPLFICIDFTVFLFFPFPPENNLLILFSTKLTTQDILSEVNGRKCRQGLTSKEHCLWRRIETILRKISAKGKVSGFSEDTNTQFSESLIIGWSKGVRWTLDEHHHGYYFWIFHLLRIPSRMDILITEGLPECWQRIFGVFLLCDFGHWTPNWANPAL